MIKSIFYEQDKDYLRHRYEKAICKENLEFELNYLVNEIKVGEIYECYVLRNQKIIDNPNIYVEKIVPIFNPQEDYLIIGTDENDKEIELKLSETEFWTS